MENGWQKQGDQPLFDDALWAKPERKSQAGKLLIVGGHLHGFDQAALAYQNSVEAGIGQVKVVLPDKLKPILGKSLDQAVFVPSTASGTMAKSASQPLAAFVDWSDTVLVIQTGDNSETALLVTDLVGERPKPMVITDEVINNVKHDMSHVLKPPTLAVLSLEGLQALLKGVGAKNFIQHDMGLRPLVLALSQEDKLRQLNLLTAYEDTAVAIARGKAVTTKRAKRPQMAALAAWAAVWWTWLPDKPLQALASASFEF